MIITWMTSPNWKKGERKFSLILSNMSKNFENFDFHPYGKHWKNVKYVLNPYPAKLIWTCQIFKKWINIVERGKKKSKMGFVRWGSNPFSDVRGRPTLQFHLAQFIAHSIQDRTHDTRKLGSVSTTTLLQPSCDVKQFSSI
jgi:hypothetical protein